MWYAAYTRQLERQYGTPHDPVPVPLADATGAESPAIGHREDKPGIRSYNSTVQRYNTERKRAIDDYNRQVRAYNSRVRANRARINSALSRLRTRSNTAQTVRVYQSAVSLTTAYEVLDRSGIDPAIADLAEREAANSLSVADALLGDGNDSYFATQSLTESKVAGMLASYSGELRDRWAGAVFALNPRNPDASRHFCTSAREIIAGIINSEAPDEDVLAYFPDAERTEQGTPTRREKIRFCLARTGREDSLVEDFVEANIKDLSALFQDLNAGTHGPAGKFSPSQLLAVKTRAEDAIGFVCAVVAE